MKKEAANPYRLLPAVEEVLSSPAVRELAQRTPRGLLVGFVGELLARWRAEIAAGALDAAGLEQRLARGELALALAARVMEEQRAGLVRVINATGVVLHTGLGRASVHPEAAAAMQRAAQGYCNLEVDRLSGERNQRDERLGLQLARLTGSEAGIAVNNNAAATLLILNTFGARRETILSRGELVEIGGSFRMPDVMERANTQLVEVGTTNRTRLADYEQACGAATGLLIKVHTSNYRLVGFTEEVGAAALAALGARRGIPSAYDLGSGRIEREGTPPLDMLGDEPEVRAAVASGMDVVCFSGDKLLGGPQAGLIVGQQARIAALRKNPLYRALRLDKVTIAGLEATLALYLAGRAHELPARRMLCLQASALRPVAEQLARELGALAGLTAEVVPEHSQPGSGSAPGIFLDSFAVRVRSRTHSAGELAAALRAGEPCVFARVHDDALLLDPRTLHPGEERELVAAFAALARR
ncbi:MAG: L-seryl-tRNA(Sec) selenium transferase [Planctomycetes bacterium]|nr:L-seryl-tRNA(Sec) selenium transferase [Planctomycetota bacterium]